MLPDDTEGIIWLLLLLVPFLILQRSLHREVQAFFLILTRRQDLSIIIFSLLFFPGVLLHEISHFLMARLLNVRTGRFSLIPRPLPGGRLQLGYVETAQVDFVRDSLIGAAPLITGSAFVIYIGLTHLGLDNLWQSWQTGSLEIISKGLIQTYHMADFWLWFYLAFTVSSTMLPSNSDRRAWWTLAFVLLGMILVALIAGAGPWMAENLAPALNMVFQTLVIAVGISIFLHLVLLPLVWIANQILSRLIGMRVNL